MLARWQLRRAQQPLDATLAAIVGCQLEDRPLTPQQAPDAPAHGPIEAATSVAGTGWGCRQCFAGLEPGKLRNITGLSRHASCF
jgi:hypothetical protein